MSSAASISSWLRGLLLCFLLWACSGPPTQLAEQNDGQNDGQTGLPNLTIDVERVRTDLAIEERVYDETACELTPDEDCIAAPGARRLLRFSVETPNNGDADLVIGEPEPPFFEYSLCHGHHHFSGFAAYELIDAQGGEVASGHKQAFCLVDTHAYVDDPDTPTTSRFNCNFQGIQRGWSDVYDSSLACQFIDITDIPDGTFCQKPTPTLFLPCSVKKWGFGASCCCSPSFRCCCCTAWPWRPRPVITSGL